MIKDIIRNDDGKLALIEVDMVRPGTSESVHLFGMQHMALPSFYEHVRTRIQELDAIVLRENADISHVVGTDQYDDYYTPSHEMFELIAEGQNRAGDNVVCQHETLLVGLDDVVDADWTVAELVRYLRSFNIDYVERTRRMISAVAAKYSHPIRMHKTIVRQDLRERLQADDFDPKVGMNKDRHDLLMKTWQEQRQHNRPIAIPWGSNHIPDFVERIGSKGFAIENTRYNVISDIEI